MTKLEWAPDQDAWTVDWDTDQFDEIEVLVVTDGESSPPTPAQMKSVALAKQIARDGLPSIDDYARQYAMGHLGSDEVDDMEDEDFEIEIHSVVIPRLRESKHAYAIFVGHSDIDLEHGVAVLCKDGTDFAVAHSDMAYTHHDWDDTEELDAYLKD